MRSSLHHALRFFAVSCVVGAAPAVASAVEGNLVLSHVKLDDTSLGGALVGGAQFGLDVTGIGDANGDGFGDIAVGARNGDDGGTDRGSFWLIFLDENGAAVAPSPLRISDTVNDPLGKLTLESGGGANLGSFFGDGLAHLPDFDGDATAELKFAVGASGGDPGSALEDSGAVYLVDIDKATWTISDVVTLASGTAGFTTLDAEDRFGLRAQSVGDWDGDGAPELAVGAVGDDDGATNNGAVYIVYLKPDGTGVKTYAKLSTTQGGFGEASESFVLTWDRKLSMDELASVVARTRLRTEQPLELLVLSACQTATGDDRAALGLAGVALQAGARSAVATLWSVQDEAAAQLITRFYTELAGGTSRAEALQHAQRALLETRAFRHPFYWAPFLLISSWL